ncbi:hypothetical protein BH24ACI4_BH24ACI4_27880 [soil metagenome]
MSGEREQRVPVKRGLRVADAHPNANEPAPADIRPAVDRVCSGTALIEA